MKPRFRFLAFALGVGLALAAPTAAQAQVSVGVNIGPPAWGPPVPQGTQYYYIPEIDGYYDIYNGIYIVFDGYQWVQQPYLDGYDPRNFHPQYIDYRGDSPWLWKGKGHPHGMPPGQAKKLGYGPGGPGGPGPGKGHGHGHGKGRH